MGYHSLLRITRRLPNIGGFSKELHPLLQLSDGCNQAVPKVPMMAFRRPKRLQDYLVRAKLRPLNNTNRGNKGTVHGKSRRCDVCNYVIPSSSFTSHTTKTSYTINHQLDTYVQKCTKLDAWLILTSNISV